MLIVACAADCRKGLFWDLEKRVKDAGIEFRFGLLQPFSWNALLMWEGMLAAEHPEDTLVFVDAWDFLFTGDAKELAALTDRHELLFHSEAVCWPEPHKADLYPPCKTPWRYVNGTGPAGKGYAIAEAIEYGLTHFPIRGEEYDICADNDQRFWTDVYLSGRGVVDTACELSVSMNAVYRSQFEPVGRRLYLKETGSTPAFVHFNGYSRVEHEALMERLR